MALSGAEREHRLRRLLSERIEREGPISFRDFMEVALYEPELGYYATLTGFGSDGDFITGPEAHPVFGALLGRQALDVWEALNRPDPFRVLEIGGGSGTLAQSMLDWAASDAPEMAARLAYSIEEVSPSLRTIQRRRLQGFAVDWAHVAEPHFVLANEVLDAMPVHRIVVRNGQPRELRVALGVGGRFEWLEADDVPAGVSAYFHRLRLLPPEGAVAEVNEALGAWARGLASRLARGAALLLDYGYLAEDLFRRAQGTLLTYYRHTLGSDPLVRIGRQDISVHVDFTTLASEAAGAGLRVVGMASQRKLLERLGIRQYWRAFPGSDERRALQSLVDPSGLGRIGALFLARGMESWQPTGLASGHVWPAPRWLPPFAGDGEADFLDQWREAFGVSDAEPG